MDIAKYIGLFLLKNNFCYLHGLGNLELRKKPATYNGQELQAPEFDVVLTPGGSIDDTLANYIATHEQTSISKAANALREFSTATRADLASGKEVAIDGIGHFYEQNGQVKFKANPQLIHVPPPVPVLRMSKRLEDAPDFRRQTNDEIKDRERVSIAWNKIVLYSIVGLAVIGAILFGVRYMTSNHASSTKDTVAVIHPVQQAPANPVPPPPDTTHKDSIQHAPAAVVPATTAPSAGGYTVILNTYPNRKFAEKRAATLNSYGNKVDVVSKDSATNYVTMQINIAASDTLHVLDSLRRVFNPKGVRIMH